MQVESPPPLVSVVVTTRNSARTLERCLRSIRQQTYPRVELIVIDNGSSDATVETAWRHADVVAAQGPERSAQRNYGAELATGEYLLFIDSDMELTVGVVADGVEAIRTSGRPATIIPEESVGEGFWVRCRILERSCYAGDDRVEAARLYARDAFIEARGYDARLTGAEDWDLSRRVARGQRLPRTAAVIIHHEPDTNLRTAFSKRRYYAPGYLRYLRKHGRDAVAQGNPLLRMAYVRNWRMLGRHPLLTAGFASLKLVELAAVLGVAVEQRFSGDPAERSGQLYCE